MEKLCQEEREKKVLDNIGLVQYLAHRYKINGNVLDRQDLIQEGILGLIEAVDTYDRERGAFAPYAATLILQYFIRVLKVNDGVFSVGYVMYKLICACKSFVLLHSREPSSQEFNAIVKSFMVTYKNALIVYEGYPYFSSQPKEMGMDYAEDADVECIEQLTRREDTDQQRVTDKNCKLNLIARLLKECKIKERYVLVLYYGLGEKKRLSLREIAGKMEVSVSRVSNIKGAGERRLRKLLEQYELEDRKWPGRLPIGIVKTEKF